MTTPLRHRLRLARRGLWYAAAIGLVAMALVAGAVSQLLPLAARHPDRIAAWLSERAGRPVAFDKVETEWTRRGPLLRLDALRVGSGQQAVLIGDAEMLVSQYGGLLPGRSFTELRLRGLDLTVERGEDGLWSVRGLPGQKQGGGDPFDALEGLGELQVIGGKLAVIAPSLGIDARIPRIDLRMRVDGPRLRVGMRATMQPGKSPLQGVLDFDRDRGDGRAYVIARDADLSAWSSLLHVAGVVVERGRGRAEAWAELRRHRVAVVTVDAALQDLQLRGTATPGGARAGAPGRAMFARLQARARWRIAAGGWRLDATTLRIGSGTHVQTLDGLVVAGGQHYGLLADRIDAAPLFAALALSDRVLPGLRSWLLSAKPDAVLHDVRVAGNRGGAMRASGHVDAFGFAPVGDAPGLSGLAGTLDGDEHGFTFDFDPARPLRFDWPRGFGVAHVVALQGRVGGWREGAGWRLETPALRVAGAGYGADVRGGLWFQGDGTRPWIDLAAHLDDTTVTTARGFWIHHLMSQKTVEWLDSALVAGRVHDGRALVSGDLDDWPFTGRDGRFEASARVEDAVVKFQPDWPAVDHVDADLAFVADGFTVKGKGVIAGVGISGLDAGIEHFGKAELQVRARGGGDAAVLLGLLRQSPLRKQYGETLDNIGASGLAAVTFGLDLPLHEAGGASKLGGTVVLAGAKLSEKRWNLVFGDVRGRAEYDRAGFSADRLEVVHDGQAGRLSLRAGDHARDRRQAFEAELEASVPSDDLLDRAPDLAWLRPYIDGRSAWTVAVAIPRSAGDTLPAPPTRLQLRSDLVGTTLALPAPLRKPSATALPTTIDAALPFGSGEVKVALGNLLALRARSGRPAAGGSQAGVRIVLGSSVVGEPPPASGLIASGHAATLDALEWIAVVKGGKGGNAGGSGMPLRRIDVTSDRLLLLGAAFPGTRLQLEPAAGGLVVQVDGDAIAGTVRVPDGEGAAISGQFGRLYWRGPAVPAAGAAETTADGSKGMDIDPARLPPLLIDVADLRFGDAALGSATLRTHATANGMRIERLQARAPKQAIDISGDWSGRGASARTHLQIGIDSGDFGALLAGFGHGGQLSGGRGRATFDASWPGTPGDLRLDAIDGTLALDARDGQLTEVEPGAGRVLGLLSLAQLPRRLTLDFHDFFSRGFAFDRLGGDVRFGAGQARSDNLVIDGPAAEIRIRGAADLRAQRFDQTIEVFPKAGNLLTVAGAIAGGPVGAAIGAAANAMLKKPLGRLAAKTYRVTGPWKDPKVEVIGHEQSRITAAAPAPAG